MTPCKHCGAKKMTPDEVIDKLIEFNKTPKPGQKNIRHGVKPLVEFVCNEIFKQGLNGKEKR